MVIQWTPPIRDALRCLKQVWYVLNLMEETANRSSILIHKTSSSSSRNELIQFHEGRVTLMRTMTLSDDFFFFTVAVASYKAATVTGSAKRLQRCSAVLEGLWRIATQTWISQVQAGFLEMPQRRLWAAPPSGQMVRSCRSAQQCLLSSHVIYKKPRLQITAATLQPRASHRGCKDVDSAVVASCVCAVLFLLSEGGRIKKYVWDV